MTTITEIASGITLITPKDKEREEIFASLADRMAADMLRSGISLDDEAMLLMMLCDRGWKPLWIANLMPLAMNAARQALSVAKTYGLQISDREVWH
jgi:hypothetical protein